MTGVRRSANLLIGTLPLLLTISARGAADPPPNSSAPPSVRAVLDDAWFHLEMRRRPHIALTILNEVLAHSLSPEERIRARALRYASRARLGEVDGRERDELRNLCARWSDLQQLLIRSATPSVETEEAAPSPPLPLVAPGEEDSSNPPEPRHRSETRVDAPATSTRTEPVRVRSDAELPTIDASTLAEWVLAIDARAETWRRHFDEHDATVIALLGRSFATNRLRAERSVAYRLATYNFIASTRDDAATVRNVWHVQFGNGGADLTCRISTRDLSTWTPVLPKLDPNEPATTDRLRAVDGVRAILHIEQAGEAIDRWFEVDVLEAVEDRYVILEWSQLQNTATIDRYARRAEREFANSAAVHLALNHANNRQSIVTLHGASTDLSTSRRDRIAPPSGGLIPRDASLLLKSLEGRATLADGSVAQFVIGDRVVAEVVGPGERTLMVDDVEASIAAGAEATAYLRLRGEGDVAVVLSTRLIR